MRAADPLIYISRVDCAACSMLSKSCAVIINDNHTDIVVNVYSNRVFLVVSQYKKLGSLVTVAKESVLREFNSDVYSTKVIFGKDEPEIHAASRYIAGELNFDKPLLVSICLKNFQVETLRAIVKAVKKIKP